MSVCMFVSTRKLSTQEGGITKLKFCDGWANNTFRYFRKRAEVEGNGKVVYE